MREKHFKESVHGFSLASYCSPMCKQFFWLLRQQQPQKTFPIYGNWCETKLALKPVSAAFRSSIQKWHEQYEYLAKVKVNKIPTKLIYKNNISFLFLKNHKICSTKYVIVETFSFQVRTHTQHSDTAMAGINIFSSNGSHKLFSVYWTTLFFSGIILFAKSYYSFLRLN